MRRWIILLALATMVAALAACGGSAASNSAAIPTVGATATPGSEASSSAGATVSVIATDFAFALDTAQAPGGTVAFTIRNNGTSQHDFQINGNGVDKKTALIDPGKTASLSLVLQPGTYAYSCTVPGHAQLGMKGTFTVI